MILADENIDCNVIAVLRAAGYKVEAVFELNRGIADEVVIAISRNPPRLTLTQNKDFGE